MLIYGWLGLLIVPPVLAVPAILALPWIAFDLEHQPAGSGRSAEFFSDSYQRRIGAPLLDRGWRPAHGFADCARLAGAAAALSRCHAGALAVGHTSMRSRPRARSSCGRRKTLPERRRRSGSVFPTSCRKAAARVRNTRLRGQRPLLRIGWAVIRLQAQTVATPQPEAAEIGAGSSPRWCRLLLNSTRLDGVRTTRERRRPSCLSPKPWLHRVNSGDELPHPSSRPHFENYLLFKSLALPKAGLPPACCTAPIRYLS